MSSIELIVQVFDDNKQAGLLLQQLRLMEKQSRLKVPTARRCARTLEGKVQQIEPAI